MALKEGMTVKVKHPEVSPNVEWLVVKAEQYGFNKWLYELKATKGSFSQSIIVPSDVEFEAYENILPPVLAPMTGMSVGNSYHQDRRLIKRIIDDVYTCKLKRPETEYPLNAVASASWDKSIRQEQEQKLHAFKRDLQEVCGIRKTEGRSYNFSYTGSRLATEHFDEDFRDAQIMWRKEGGCPLGQDFRYDTWITFMGLYACYRKVMESKV
jgi:hypothetical protein